ncbi:MAG: hypothetical protein ACE5OZ_16365 [Candidatus Heimdallarchaeota archaeon]
MREKIPEKANPPLCIRLGFFSREAWILILVVFPLVDLGYPLLLAEDHLSLLETSLPMRAFFWLIMILLFFAGNWAITQIRNLFGIDFRSRDRPLKEQAHFEALFEGDLFKDYQVSTYKKFTSIEMPLIAILVSGILVVVGLIYPFLTETDRLITNYPEIAEDELYYAYFAFRILPLSIFLIWFIFSGFGGLLLLLEVVFSFHSLAKFPGLSLSQATRYIEAAEEKREIIEFSQKSEIVKFSLKRFKRRSKGIPDFLLRVNIIISIGLALIGLFVFLFVSGITDEETRFMVAAIAFGAIIFIILVNLFLFLFPQISLHNQLERARNSMIESLEELYELKKFQYLQIAATSAKENKEILWTDMQALIHLTEELESILTWPFNYPQLLTLLGGSLLALIPVALQALLEL